MNSIATTQDHLKRMGIPMGNPTLQLILTVMTDETQDVMAIDRGEDATMAETTRTTGTTGTTWTIRTNLAVTNPATSLVVAQVDLMTTMTVTIDDPEEILVARLVEDLLALPAATRILPVTETTMATTETRKERTFLRRTLLVTD